MIKKLSISLLLFLSVFLVPKSVNAQYGTYTCFGSGSTGGCQQTANNCTNGGTAQPACNTKAGSACSGTYPCKAPVTATPAPGSCTPVGGDCSHIACCSGATCTNVTGTSIRICMGNVSVPTGTQLPSGPQLTSCSVGGGLGIETAIGCIPISSEQGIAAFFLRWGLGIGGGIAFLMIVFAGYQITSSAGDPHRLQAGKELLTAAITGLLLLVFSAFILRFIGVDFLGVF